MNPSIEALVVKGRRSLANAKLSHDAGDYDFAVSRAYYAMFYLAEALLLSRGLRFTKHATVIAEFTRSFVQTGELPQELAATLRAGFEERLVGDYQYLEMVPARSAERGLQ